MKKTLTFGVLAGAALTLAACSGNTAGTEAEEPVAEAEATETMPAVEGEGMTAEDAAALEAAAGAAEGTDTNSNPIPPAAVEEAPAE